MFDWLYKTKGLHSLSLTLVVLSFVPSVVDARQTGEFAGDTARGVAGVGSTNYVHDVAEVMEERRLREIEWLRTPQLYEVDGYKSANSEPVLVEDTETQTMLVRGKWEPVELIKVEFPSQLTSKSCGSSACGGGGAGVALAQNTAQTVVRKYSVNDTKEEVLAKLGDGDDIILTSHKLGTRFDECFNGPPGENSKGMPVPTEDMGVGLERAYKRAKGAVQKCQGEDEAANTCCRRNPVSCVAKSKFAGLLTMALNAAPVAASMALSKRCRKVKTLLGTATSLTTATAQLCQLKVSSCTRQCEQTVGGRGGGPHHLSKLILAIGDYQRSCCGAEPPVGVCPTEDCQTKTQYTIGCLTQIQENAREKAYQCNALEAHVVPKMQEAMMVQMLGSGLAARCEAVTSDQPDAKDIKPPAAGGCDENPHLPLCKGPRDLSFKPGQLTPSSLDDDGLDNYDINDGPAIPDGALDYQGNPDSQPGNLGPVQGGGGGGGGGGSLGGGSGGGGGGGGGGSGARRPASSAGASTQGSILKGFNKGGGFSGAGGGSGGYSQRAGGGYGASGKDGKRRFNLGKYFGKKTKGSALNKVNRHIASATGSIWVNIAQRYKAVCHKQKLYCD